MTRLIAVVLLFPSLGFGFYSVKLQSTSPTEMKLQMSVNADALKTTTVQWGNKSFLRIQNNEGLANNLDGLPEIPRIHKWVAVPEGAEFEVKVNLSHPKIIPNVLLYPAQKDRLEKERMAFEFNEQRYSKKVWADTQGASLQPTMKLGPVTVLPITLTPVQYEAATKELKVYTEMTVDIVSHSDKKSLLNENARISPFIASQLRGLVLNAEEVLAGRESKAAPSILIAAPASLMAQAKQLGAVHKKDGATVTYFEVPAAVPATKVADLLKTQNQNLNLDAVLLFGDEKLIPLYQSTGGELGDVYYSYLEGADEVSDLAVGRLPVSDAVEASIIIKKIKKHRELAAARRLSKNVMLLAHNEEYPGKYTKNQEEVRTGPNAKGLNFEVQYGGNKATNDSVIESATEKNFGIINYRGHGSSVDWWDWDAADAPFGFGEVEALPDDATKLSIFFNVACDNGAIQESSDVFVEKLLFPKKGDTYQGAVGTFGATEPSYTEVNHRFNKHLFASLSASNDVSFGNIYTMANNKLTQENGGTAPVNVKMYVLYSDPTLKLIN